MIIRQEQMRAFQEVADKAFISQTADFLREKHADATLNLPEGGFIVAQISDEILHQLVGNGMARARRYGMKQKSSLEAFVVLMVLVAPNFDGHPLIRKVLTDPSVPPDSRIDALWKRTRDENWQAAAARYDRTAWFAAVEENER